MPIFTGTPVQISGNPPNTAQGASLRRKFVNFEIGANQYAVLCDSFIPVHADPAYPLMIFKSTDDGATWTLQDSSNAPATTSGNIYVVANGSTLKIIYMDPTAGGPSPHRIMYVEFDTATDLYGSPNPGPSFGVSPFFASSADFQAAQLAGGDFLVLSGAAINGSAIIGARLTAGVWSAVIPLLGSTFPNTGRVYGVVMDSSDTAHLVQIYGDVGSGITSLFYYTVDSGNLLTGPATITTTASGLASDSGPFVIWQNRIILSMVFGNTRPFLWEGTPVSSPAWTSTLGGDPSGHARESLFLVTDSTHGEIWWTDAVNSQLWFQTYDGSTLGTPTVFYDAVANPPAGGESIPSGDQFITQPSVLKLASGRRAAVLGIEYNYPAEDSSMFYLAGSQSAYRNKVY